VGRNESLQLRSQLSILRDNNNVIAVSVELLCLDQYVFQVACDLDVSSYRHKWPGAPDGIDVHVESIALPGDV